MSRKRTVKLALLLTVFAASCFSTWQYLSRSEIDKARESIMNVDFLCGEDCREKVERWNVSGYSRACYKNNIHHGRIIFWEEEYLNLEGFYKNGQKDGEWTVFNQDGTIYVKIFFEDGVKKGKQYYQVQLLNLGENEHTNSHSSAYYHVLHEYGHNGVW